MSKKQKNGFSIKLYSKGSLENKYTVYFEHKGKVVFCYIRDGFLEKTFKGKSVCHEGDTFVLEDGMTLAYEETMQKRFCAYQNQYDIIENMLQEVENHADNIDIKFNKFLQDRIKEC